MRWVNKERLKFCILVILIFSSLFQLGILWNYQDYGFPFSFFEKKIFAVEDDDIKDSNFEPYRIILAERYAGSRWVIGNPEDSDYAKLWSYTKKVIKEAVVQSQLNAPIDSSKWQDMVAKLDDAIIFDFKVSLKRDIFMWHLGIEYVPDDAPKAIKKVMLVPWENSGILYITDDVKIYTYGINVNETQIKIFKEMFKRYSNDSNLLRYTFMKELDPYNMFRLAFNKDVLLVKQDPAYGSMNTIRTYIPGFGEKDYGEDDIARVLLGVDMDAYDRSKSDDNRFIEFKTQNKIYKIGNDGILDYRNLTSYYQTDKGDVKDALVKAYEFVARLKKLNKDENVSLYLSGLNDKEKDYYEFFFDYKIEGIPVMFDFSYRGKQFDHAFTIRANSIDVTSCTALFRRFEIERSGKEYIFSTNEFMDKLFSQNKELKNNKNIEVKDLFISYRGSGVLEPVWVFETNDKNYIVPIQLK